MNERVFISKIYFSVSILLLVKFHVSHSFLDMHITDLNVKYIIYFSNKNDYNFSR